MSLEIDSVDARILALLSKDGRLQNTDIARRLGVSEGMVRKRIAAMLEKRVFQFSIWANPLKIGYEHLLQVDIQAQPGKVRQVADDLARMKETVFVGICLGAYDVRSIVLARSNEHMYELALRINAVRGVLRSTTTSIVSIVKRDYDYAIEASEAGHVPAAAGSGEAGLRAAQDGDSALGETPGPGTGAEQGSGGRRRATPSGREGRNARGGAIRTRGRRAPRAMEEGR